MNQPGFNALGVHRTIMYKQGINFLLFQITSMVFKFLMQYPNHPFFEFFPQRFLPISMALGQFHEQVKSSSKIIREPGQIGYPSEMSEEGIPRFLRNDPVEGMVHGNRVELNRSGGRKDEGTVVMVQFAIRYSEVVSGKEIAVSLVEDAVMVLCMSRAIKKIKGSPLCFKNTKKRHYIHKRTG